MDGAMQIIYGFMGFSVVLATFSIPLAVSYRAAIWDILHKEIDAMVDSDLAKTFQALIQSRRRKVLLATGIMIGAVALLSLLGMASLLVGFLAVRDLASAPADVEASSSGFWLAWMWNLALSQLGAFVLLGLWMFAVQPLRLVGDLHIARVKKKSGVDLSSRSALRLILGKKPAQPGAAVASPGQGVSGVLQSCVYLLQPMFWIGLITPLVAGGVAGMVASPFEWACISKLVLACLAFLAISVGTQAFNDITDIEGDTINKPGRPLPRGLASKSQFVWIGVIAYSVAVPAAYFVNMAFFLLSLSILAINHFYGAPISGIPTVRLKTNPLTTQASIFLLFGLLPAVAGFLVYQVSIPYLFWMFAIAISIWRAFVLISKDYSDMRGDEKNGIITFPIMLGARSAAVLETYGTTVAQFLFVLLALRLPVLLAIPAVALGVWLSAFMVWCMLDPVRRAMTHGFRFVWPLYAGQMLLVAIGLRGIFLTT